MHLKISIHSPEGLNNWERNHILLISLLRWLCISTKNYCFFVLGVFAKLILNNLKLRYLPWSRFSYRNLHISFEMTFLKFSVALYFHSQLFKLSGECTTLVDKIRLNRFRKFLNLFLNLVYIVENNVIVFIVSTSPSKPSFGMTLTWQLLVERQIPFSMTWLISLPSVHHHVFLHRSYSAEIHSWFN